MYSLEYIILIFFLNCVVLKQVPAVYHEVDPMGPSGSIPVGMSPLTHASLIILKILLIHLPQARVLWFVVTP
jgi:hypothetical protein